jgi:hypothetical protein
MFSGRPTALNYIVILNNTSRDVKFCLISEDNYTYEIIVFQNLHAHVCRKLRSKLFTVTISFWATLICTGLGVCSCEEICGQLFVASVNLLGRSISNSSNGFKFCVTKRGLCFLLYVGHCTVRQEHVIRAALR